MSNAPERTNLSVLAGPLHFELRLDWQDLHAGTNIKGVVGSTRRSDPHGDGELITYDVTGTIRAALAELLDSLDALETEDTRYN